MGLPDEDALKEYSTTHQRAMARREKFFNPTPFVKPVDPNKLSDVGKAYREKMARVNSVPTQLDGILARLHETVRTSNRKHILDLDTAKYVVDQIFAKEMSRKNKTLWFTDEQSEILENIVRYFIGDPESPYALHKGLFLYGKFGVGKTIMFRVMQTLCKITPIPDMYFEEVPTKNYVKAYIDFKESKDKKNDPFQKYIRGNLLLNDLGEERQVIKSYTNIENPMDELLSERNVAFDQYGYFTHVTSNLGLSEENNESILEDQLAQLYGPRILDRFYDQFETIHVPGDSKRG